jgi:predicted outer membrane repeat protein
MTLWTTTRDLFLSLAPANIHCRRHRSRLSLQALEDRSVPAVFTVNSLADVAPGPVDPTAKVLTLRQAVELANQHPGADLIRFAPGLSGTITLTNGQLEVSDDVSIFGPGAPQLAVSGNNESRVLFIDPGATVSVSALTIRDGQAMLYGGGLFNEGNLTLSACAVINNMAINQDLSNTSFGGGGIENRGTMTLSDCQVANNTLVGTQTFFQEIDNGGGGIDNNAGNLTIYSSFLTGNQSFNGGALRTSNGTLTMVGSVVSGNTAAGIVGGAMSLATSVNHITGCVIADNHITSRFGCGGAFSNDSSDTVLEACLFTGNSSALFGGAIDVAAVEEPGHAVSSVVANGCVFAGNQCISTGGFFGLPGGTGGAFAVLDGSSLTLNGCSVANNQASTDGGAIWIGNVINNSGCNVTVTNSSLVGNSAGRNGGAVYVRMANSLILDQVLVSLNQAGGHGGGLYLATTPPVFDIATALITQNSPENIFIAS